MLPQLEVGTFAGQIFWFVIAMIVLWFFISKELIPKISNAIIKRNDALKSLQDEVKNLEEEIKTISEDYKLTMTEAKAELQKISDLKREEYMQALRLRKKEIMQEAQAQTHDMRQKLLEEHEIFNQKLPDFTKEIVNACISNMLSASIDHKLWEIIREKISRN